MTINNYKNDIIDVEYVVDENQTSSSRPNENQTYINGKNSFFNHFTARKKIHFARPNFFTLILISPIIIFLIFIALFIILASSIFLLPKIIRIAKSQKNFFQSYGKKY